MRIRDASALSAFARNTAQSASEFAGVVRNLIMDVRDSYRPELHYMRGPGPKWAARHRPRPDSILKVYRPPGSTSRCRCICAVAMRLIASDSRPRLWNPFDPSTVEKGQHANHRRRPDVPYAGQHSAAGLPRGNRREGRDADASLHTFAGRACRLEVAFDLLWRAMGDRRISASLVTTSSRGRPDASPRDTRSTRVTRLPPGPASRCWHVPQTTPNVHAETGAKG